ncbi:hypothetical protein, partial [Microbispora hainanensis]|uniref:hypothetical protein n=1 Tax=Microbispora hainanensis TaxID=568844 RepID=UPI00142EC54C
GKYESKVYPNKWLAGKAKDQLAADKTTALSKLDVVEVKELSRWGKETAVSVADFQSYNKGKNLTSNGPWAPFTSAVTTPIDGREYGNQNWNKDSWVSQDGKTLYFRTPKPNTKPNEHKYDYFKRTFNAKILSGYKVVGFKF